MRPAANEWNAGLRRIPPQCPCALLVQALHHHSALKILMNI
jgi:hypothetical protein